MTDLAFNGDRLRAYREQRGLSLKDVYGELHIPIAHLEALERGDFDNLPVQTYVKGYIRSYCALLDLDSAPFVEACRAAAKSAPATLRSRQKDVVDHEARWQEMGAWAAACGVLALMWFAYIAVLAPGPSQEATVDASTLGIESIEPEPESINALFD